MKISVVTVCFNSAATIVDTLKSVSAQTWLDVEHIVIDGASTDDTVALVRQHGTRVSTLVSERDKGIYDAMNKGLARCTGELVGFLNADDTFADEKVLAEIAAAAATAPQPDVVFGDLLYVAFSDTSRVVRRWTSGPFRHARLHWGWMPPHPTFYARREVLQRLGGFDTSLRIAADYDFMLRCLTQPGVKASYIDEVLVHMRTGGVSNRSVRAMLKKSGEDLRVMRRHRTGGLLTLACKNLRKLPQFW